MRTLILVTLLSISLAGCIVTTAPRYSGYYEQPVRVYDRPVYDKPVVIYRQPVERREIIVYPKYRNNHRYRNGDHNNHHYKHYHHDNRNDRRLRGLIKDQKFTFGLLGSMQ